MPFSTVTKIVLLLNLLLFASIVDASGGYKEKRLIGSIYFPSGSMTLNKSARRELARIAEEIRRLEEKTAKAGERLIIRLEGYSDSVGDADANLFISMMRAAVVEEYLVKVEGVSVELYLTGFGETKVKRPERTAEERRRNRRVDVVRIIGEDGEMKIFRQKGKKGKEE